MFADRESTISQSVRRYLTPKIASPKPPATDYSDLVKYNPLTYSLDKFLNQHFPNDILMPVPLGEKRPEFSHRNGAWTWELFHNRSIASGSRDVGVLLRDLCVVDVDGFDEAADLENRFPILKTVPCEQTNHGYHYWFRRPAIATEMRYFDGAGQREVKIDFKSVLSNGTSGFVVIAPSTNKTWVRTLWDTPIVDIPLELLETVALPLSTVVDEMTLRFDDNEEWTVTDCKWLNLMSYFQPYVLADSHDVAVPCRSDVFHHLFQLLQTNELSFMDPTPERFLELLRIADMLGLNDKTMKRLLTGVARCQVDMYEACPEWWRTRIDERLWRESGAGADNILCVVDDSLAASLLYVQLDCLMRRPGHIGAHPGLETRDMWLLPDLLPPTYTDTRVLVSDPVVSAERSLPPLVRDLLQQYRGNLVIAGGAILGAVGRHVCEGSDYDLFIVGLDDAEANEMLHNILRDYQRTWTKFLRTGHAVTMIVDGAVVQIILRLYANFAQVLVGFDIVASKIGGYYDEHGTFRVECSPAFIPAIKHMAFALDTTKWGYASVARHLKYRQKGFQIYIPGHRRKAARTDASGRSHGLVALFRAEHSITKLRRRGSSIRAKQFRSAPLSNNEVKTAVKGLRYMTDYTTVAKINGALKYVIKSIVRRGREMFFGAYTPVYAPTHNRDKPFVFARCDFTKNQQYAVFHTLNANVWEAYDPARLARYLKLPITGVN